MSKNCKLANCSCSIPLSLHMHAHSHKLRQSTIRYVTIAFTTYNYRIELPALCALEKNSLQKHVHFRCDEKYSKTHSFQRELEPGLQFSNLLQLQNDVTYLWNALPQYECGYLNCNGRHSLTTGTTTDKIISSIDFINKLHKF